MSYTNYDDVLSQLRVFGLLVDGIDVDTARPRRCRVEGDKSRERRGWYWLSSFMVDGQSLIIGAYGIYQGNDSGKQTIKLPKDKRDRLTPEQIEAQKARQREAQKRADAERQREADKSAARALSVWKKCLKEGESEYLARKQIGAHGVRFSDTGAVVVPMMDAKDTLRGLQFILPRGHERRAKTGRDKEFWPAGLQMHGTFHLVGGIPRDILLVAEGYATAATLHEATGLPVAVVWSANNILPACQALKKKFKRARQLICADDDWLQKCGGCGKYTPVATENCDHCGQPHGKQNAGCSNAEAAAVAIGGAWVAPVFNAPRPDDKKGPTDFNDLHVIESLATVNGQIEHKLNALRWLRESPRGERQTGGAGEGRNKAQSVMALEEAIQRFIPLDDGTGKHLFDTWTNKIALRDQMVNILPAGVRWDDVKRAPEWIERGAYYLDQVGFDPSGKDGSVQLNTWRGWPLQPKQGRCDLLLELLEYLCSGESNGREVYTWLLRWMAYPLQNPGAKMASAVIMHGPQGTGKSTVFQTLAKIYGDYSTVLNQRGLEDKFNSDWSDSKLFILAEEVVTRAEMWHIKNELKELVTGEWIRINPKNIAAYRQRNHVNIVYLSNEDQPLPIENDDRRHLVIWTQPMLTEEYYDQVFIELENGGTEAFYHYLLNLDLGDFHPKKRPPMTESKKNLIHLSLPSERRFIKDYINAEAGYPVCPMECADLYAAYVRWCRANGERNPRPSNQFGGMVNRLDGWVRKKAQVLTESGKRVAKWVYIPADEVLSAHKADKPDGETESKWVTEGVDLFKNALNEGEKWAA